MCSREEYLSRCGLFWILECDPPSRWVRWVFMHPVQLICLLLAASLFDRQKGCVLRKRWSRQALILSNIDIILSVKEPIGIAKIQAETCAQQERTRPIPFLSL